jgi:hypothetical protein
MILSKLHRRKLKEIMATKKRELGDPIEIIVGRNLKGPCRSEGLKDLFTRCFGNPGLLKILPISY